MEAQFEEEESLNIFIQNPKGLGVGSEKDLMEYSSNKIIENVFFLISSSPCIGV